MLRTIAVALLFVLYLVLTLPVLGILALIGRFNPALKGRISLKMVQTVFGWVLMIAGAKVTVQGRENIPDDEPVLYVGNHRSYFDIIVCYRLIKGSCGFIAKKEMEKIPLLRNWMRNLHCLFLNRTDIKEGMKTILTAIEEIRSGVSIWVFPEGTRSREEGFRMLPFKEGSLKMAEKTGCPIIPVAIRGTADLFENHLPRIRPAQITVQFGTPIYTKELSREEKKFLGSYTQRQIGAMLTELTGEDCLPEAIHGKD